jgi:metallo-beta-lactamase family protein
MATIQFLGGAGTVTGSKYLVTSGETHILIDCGMFQGLKSLRLQNWDQFPIDPALVHAIILTHAHIDHSGYIPRLIKNGFKGKIYATSATMDLCEILLPDAGHLAEEEAEYLNKHRRSKHDPALPLFTLEEGQQALDYFEAVPLNQKKSITDKLHFEFRYAGHILGAASVLLEVEGKKIFFTGDIGRSQDPLFFEPQAIPPADYLITESTYGNRKHGSNNVLNDLEKIIKQAMKSHGVIIIPAFAVGRAQELMFYLWQLKKQKRLPAIPMYLNSPMATNVNSLFVKHHQLHRLTKNESEELCSVVKYIRSVEESKALNEKKGPMLIISASGMLTGGRVLHHIKKFGPEARNTILLAGFQAAGTRGEALEHHAAEVKIHGEYVQIRAQIKVLENMSAHADYQEILDWFARSHIQPKKVFITHGEPAAADELRRRLTEKFNYNCVIPEQNEVFDLI